MIRPLETPYVIVRKLGFRYYHAYYYRHEAVRAAGGTIPMGMFVGSAKSKERGLQLARAALEQSLRRQP